MSSGFLRRAPRTLQEESFAELQETRIIQVAANQFITETPYGIVLISRFALRCESRRHPEMTKGQNMTDNRNWLIDHTGIGVSDIHRSARFYEAALRPLGIKIVMRINKNFQPVDEASVDLGGVAYGVDYPAFWIDIFHPHSIRQHTAFRARSRHHVDAFHRTAVLAGGTDHGAPGLRSGGYPPGYYAAFVLDPDGNNIEVVFRED